MIRTCDEEGAKSLYFHAHIKDSVMKSLDKLSEHTDDHECIHDFGAVTACSCSKDLCNDSSLAPIVTCSVLTVVMATLASLEIAF